MVKRNDDLEEDSLEVFRHTPTGTNDPNIVGDVGPYDVPPGSDGHHEHDFDNLRGAPLIDEIDEIDEIDITDSDVDIDEPALGQQEYDYE